MSDLDVDFDASLSTPLSTPSPNLDYPNQPVNHLNNRSTSLLNEVTNQSLSSDERQPKRARFNGSESVSPIHQSVNQSNNHFSDHSLDQSVGSPEDGPPALESVEANNQSTNQSINDSNILSQLYSQSAQSSFPQSFPQPEEELIDLTDDDQFILPISHSNSHVSQPVDHSNNQSFTQRPPYFSQFTQPPPTTDLNALQRAFHPTFHPTVQPPIIIPSSSRSTATQPIRQSSQQLSQQSAQQSDEDVVDLTDDVEEIPLMKSSSTQSTNPLSKPYINKSVSQSKPGSALSSVSQSAKKEIDLIEDEDALTVQPDWSLYGYAIAFVKVIGAIPSELHADAEVELDYLPTATDPIRMVAKLAATEDVLGEINKEVSHHIAALFKSGTVSLMAVINEVLPQLHSISIRIAVSGSALHRVQLTKWIHTRLQPYWYPDTVNPKTLTRIYPPLPFSQLQQLQLVQQSTQMRPPNMPFQPPFPQPGQPGQMQSYATGQYASGQFAGQSAGQFQAGSYPPGQYPPVQYPPGVDPAHGFDGYGPPAAPMTTDIESHLESVFSTEEQLHDIDLSTLRLPASLKTSLHSYQMQGLAWMIEREKVRSMWPKKKNAAVQDTAKRRQRRDPFTGKMYSVIDEDDDDVERWLVWAKEREPDGSVRYVHQTTQERLKEPPQAARGGILADEMGLGKTLQMLSLIASTVPDVDMDGEPLVPLHPNPHQSSQPDNSQSNSQTIKQSPDQAKSEHRESDDQFENNYISNSQDASNYNSSNQSSYNSYDQNNSIDQFGNSDSDAFVARPRRRLLRLSKSEEDEKKSFSMYDDFADQDNLVNGLDDSIIDTEERKKNSDDDDEFRPNSDDDDFIDDSDLSSRERSHGYGRSRDKKSKSKHRRSRTISNHPGPTLIVCPLSVIHNWQSQIATHIREEAGWRVVVYHGPNRHSEARKLHSADVVITTYNIVAQEFPDEEGKAKKRAKKQKQFDSIPTAVDRPSDIQAVIDLIDEDEDIPFIDKVKAVRESPLFAAKWFRVILDEAHCIRERKTLQSRACVALDAERRWAVTGTPFQNKLDDGFALLSFLRVEPFTDHLWWTKLILAPLKQRDGRGLERLQTIMSSICLRRRKTDEQNGKRILVLPEKVCRYISVELTDEEKHLYDILSLTGMSEFRRLMKTGDLMRNYSYILEMLLRMRQSCDHASLVPDHYHATGFGMSGDQMDETRRLLTLLEDSCADACDKCGRPLDSENAVVTPCVHFYHKECFSTLAANLPSAVASTSSRMQCAVDQATFESDRAVTLQHVSVVRAQQSRDAFAAIAARRDSDRPRISAKMQALMNELYDCQKVGDKAVVFSQWTSFLDLLEPTLDDAGIRYVRLDGAMDSRSRQAALQDFEHDNAIRVFLISLKAGGVGLNLTAANRVYLMDIWWNPAAEDQAVDRIHRLGQTKNVDVVRMIVKSTVEERVLDLQNKKREMTQNAMLRVGQRNKKDDQAERMNDLRSLFGVSGGNNAQFLESAMQIAENQQNTVT